MSKTTTAGIQTVERRLHTRHRARTTVYITTPTGRKKLCRAINLSATGVFVETTNLGLRKGQQVELAFAINLGAVTNLHRRTAVVAHVSRGQTIHPGEVWGSGTVTGGSGLELGRWLHPGDVVELEVEGIGVLRNIITS